MFYKFWLRVKIVVYDFLGDHDPDLNERGFHFLRAGQARRELERLL